MSAVNSVADLRANLEILLQKTKSAEAEAPSRYWYPLSFATYGVDEVQEALDSMCSYRTTMGTKTRDFEHQFAAWQGSTDALMVNSGSSADLLLCMLLTNPAGPLVPPGSEIIVPVVTWPTQIWSPMMMGLKVKLVDVDPETLNVDIDELERTITPQTSAIFLVHLMGNPCNMDRIATLAKKHNLQIIEDCCEAMGAEWAGKKVGTFGLGGAFSFFFSHHITSMEGGMISINHPEHVDTLRILRAHGWIRNVDPTNHPMDGYPDIDPRYAFVNWGINVRPMEVQASFAMHQLKKADAFGRARAGIANKFFTYTSSKPYLRMPKVESKATPSWLALPIMVAKDAPFTRNQLTAFLEAEGVETRPIVTGNVARHPVAKLFPEFGSRPFPGADQVHDRGFYIGLSPVQPANAVDRLCETFDRFDRSF